MCAKAADYSDRLWECRWTMLVPVCDFCCKKMNHMWCRNKVGGMNYAYSDKGWIDHELFFHFLEKQF